MALGISLTLSAALAGESDGHRAKYEDYWFYCSHPFQTNADIGYYRDLIAKAKAAGYNGMVSPIRLGYNTHWNEKSRACFAEVRRICDVAGIEIVPCIWSVGYGAMIGVNNELVESEPARDIPYVARDGKAVFKSATVSVSMVNGDFESFNAAKNRFTGWHADHPGAESFVDTTVSHGGRASIRFEPDLAKDTNGLARLYQLVKVKPGHRYRFTAWIRADGLEPSVETLRMLVMRKGVRNSLAAGKDVNRLLLAEGWRKVETDFNSGEATEAYLYVGTWGGKHGKFWVDDCSIKETGLREVCQRKGTPFEVRNAVTGQVYARGKDYEMPPVRMPKGEEIEFKIPSGSAIKEGDDLLVDAYVPAQNGPKSQRSTCMSDPRLYELFEKSAAGIMEACAPRKWLLAVDEVRNGNTCPLCTARKTDMAHIFGECVTKMHAIIKKVRPDAVVYAWSDMFDPNHNARDNYYGCKGTFAGVWDLIPKDIVMCCWYRKKCELTVPFFTRHGFRVLAAGYYDYDGSDAEKDRPWVDILNRTPGAKGFMYTTWQRKYDLLPVFGKFIHECGRPCREGLSGNGE